jgi:hypothetical protein
MNLGIVNSWRRYIYYWARRGANVIFLQTGKYHREGRNVRTIKTNDTELVFILSRQGTKELTK